MKKILRIKISTILAILTLTTMALLVIFPTTTAQNIEYSKTTHCYIGAVPNPVGVNQQVLLHIGMFDFLRVYYQGWEGLTVSVTKPDGSTETLGPFRTDSTGGTGTIYIPNMVGVYKFQTHFPEQTFDWEGGISRVPFTGVVRYEASDSEILELVVQQTQVEYYPGHSLPSEYWTRPIDSQLREWSQISSNWLVTTRYAGPMAMSPAPETGHILWTKPLEYGGLIGNEYGSWGYETGDAYEGKLADSVVINGILYYNQFPSRGTGVEYDVVAVDLKTGEELWRRNWGDNRRLSFGQIFYWDAFNMHGAFPYLWSVRGRTWHAYDITTGRWIYTIENVPSGTRVYGPKGEIYIYTVNTNNNWMTLWNSSSTVQPMTSGTSDDGSWRPQGQILDAAGGIEWNVTIPSGLIGDVKAAFFGDRILGSNARPLVPDIGRDDIPIELWAINVKPGQEGQLIFKKTWHPPAGDYAIAQGDVSVEDGVFTLYAKEIRAHFGFDINTGNQIWGPTPSEDYTMTFMMHIKIRLGKLFSCGYAGKMYAYDLNSGNLLWTYVAKEEYLEQLWSNNWALYPAFFTSDNKIVLFNTEHSTIDPKARGSPLICLDAEDGEELWTLNLRGHHWGGHPLLADSVIVTINSMDNQIYAIGKGPSATTVEGPLASVPKGDGVTLVGKVIDISTGTEDPSIKSRFPNGVPAVADQNMKEWMQYVYNQFEKPTDTMGVSVKIEIVDPNGEYAWIGTATTDVYGNYGYTFNPKTEGQYMIMASFDGSGAYWGSTATTYLSVGPAITPSGPITPETPATPLITTEIALVLVAAIAAIVIVAYLVMRKK